MIDFSKTNTYTGPCNLQQEEETKIQETTDTSSVEMFNNVEFCLANFDDPKSYDDAINSEEAEKWEEAMDEEVNTLLERNVFKQVKRPENQKILGNKWVYVRKRDEHGVICRYRARLVAQGYKQREGIDYQECYAPVIDFVVIRLFLFFLVIMKHWANKHIDITCAYLYGELNETTYMEIPEGYKKNENNVWLLNKSIYGLHQSSHCWFNKLDQELKKLGFINLISCKCAYRLEWNCIILVYVDDILILTKNDTIMDDILARLESVFDIKDLGRVTTFLGIDIKTTEDGLSMSQTRYIQKMRKIYEVIPYKRCYEPLRFGSIIKTTGQEKMEQDLPYRNLIGSLLYIARHTRPDILYAVNTLAKYCNNYDIEIWNHLTHLWNYVITTEDKILQMKRTEEPQIIAYSDASWASDPETRKSTSGYIIMCGENPIVWRSVKQTITALSTMESELIAAVETTKEIIFIHRILDECAQLLPASTRETIELKIDNQAAIQCILNQVDNSRTKYLDLRIHFIREKVSEKLFKIVYINTKFNLADLFTKALPKVKIYQLSSYLQ